MKKAFIIIGAFAILLSAYLVIAKRPVALEVETAVIEKGDIVVAVDAMGTVVSSGEYAAAAPSAGIVDEVYVKNGQTVRKGDVLFSLRSTDLDIQIEEALGEYMAVKDRAGTSEVFSGSTGSLSMIDKKTKAALALAQNSGYDYEDFNNLVSQLRLNPDALENTLPVNSFTAADVSVAASGMDADTIELSTAQKKLNTLEKKKEDLKVKSRIAGKVLSCGIKAGDGIVAGAGAMVIGDDKHVSIDAYVFEREMGKISIGQKAQVTHPSDPGLYTTGQINEINSMIEPFASEQGMINAGRVNIEMPAHFTAVPGQSVDVALITNETKSVPVLSLDAFTSDDEVFILQGGKVHKRKVKTGLRDDFFAEITEGLALGDEVVIAPPKELRDGMEVVAID